MLFMGLFSGIGEDVANFFRDFIWDLISMQIWCIQNLINALTNGVLSFGILDNTWIKDGYTACIALMFIILPVKLVYEFIFSLIRDDESNMDLNKKLLGGITGVIIAASLNVVIPIANNLSINVSKALIGQQYSGGTTVDNPNSIANSTVSKDLSKELVVSTLCAFGGMDRNNTTFSFVTDGNGKAMDLGAERFYENITNSDDALKGYEGEPSEAKKRSSNDFFSRGIYDRWSFYYRWDTNGAGLTDGTDDWDLLGKFEDTSTYPEVEKKSTDYGDYSVATTKEQADKAYKYITSHSGEYIWDFGYIGTIVGLAIFMILLFIVTIEVAMRIIMIGFLYIIGPLCSLSLTNYNNPQAFVVWKNSILGMFVVNVTQIFLLQLLMNIASDISSAGSGNSNIIASIALYLGSFFAIIAIPGYVQSMIGGYGQGIMESMQQLKGTLGATWGMTGGMLLGAGRTIMGRHNDNTGHLTGGLRGAVRGNKNYNGERIGGVANRARAIRGGIFGNTSNSSGFAASESGGDINTNLSGRGQNDSTSSFSNGNMNANGEFNDIQQNNDSSFSRNVGANRQTATRYGGIFGRSGIVDKTTSAIKNPTKTIKNAYHGMADVIGVRGSGPKNWESFDKKDGEK